MISNFERKYGKYAIKNLTLYLIAGYVIGYMLSLINPTLYGLLTFNPYMILHGQTDMAYSNMGFNNAGGIKYLHNNYADSLLSVGTDFGKNMGNVQI